MFASYTNTKTQDDKTLRPQRRGRNYSMPKSRCKNRSEWRVRPGKSPERLSPNYHFECEFGSALMLCWRDDGVEPVYVCEEHAQEIAHLAEVRSATVREKQEASSHSESAAAATQTTAILAPVTSSDIAADLAHDAASPATPDTAQNGERHVSSGADGENSASTREAKTQKSPRTTPRTTEERCAAIEQLICELAAQLENALTQSENKISIAITIDAPLEKATQEIISNQSTEDAQKDATLQQLGSLQQSLKQDAPEEITALQANQIKQTVWSRLNGENQVADEAKPAYRAVYDSLAAAINAAVPRARHLEARVNNLLKMKADLRISAPSDEPAPATLETPVL